MLNDQGAAAALQSHAPSQSQCSMFDSWDLDGTKLYNIRILGLSVTNLPLKPLLEPPLNWLSNQVNHYLHAANKTH